MSKKHENEGIPVKRYIAAGLFILCFAAVLCGCGVSRGWQYLEDGTYYFSSDGEAVTGWQEIDGVTYWFSESGLLHTGWLELGTDVYYLSEDGIPVTGWQEIDGSKYYFRESGTRVLGWFSMEGDNYFLTAGGLCAGVLEIDGVPYLFNEEGILATGLTEVDGKIYCGGPGGHPLTGVQQVDGKWYCFADDGSALTGWVERDGFSYYYTEDGSAATGFVTVDGQELAFSAFGQQLLLVNPWNFLPEDYSVELVGIGGDHQVATIAYDDYKAMIADCKAAGFKPAVCSSYRTWDYQKKLYQNRIYRFQLQGYSKEDATELAGTIVAEPGTSEHQLGLALDLIDSSNWKLDESQASTPTQQWLMEHSWEYGWILRYPEGTSDSTGIIYEPWHYRYVGREAAADIHASGLCLEDYLNMLTQA